MSDSVIEFRSVSKKFTYLKHRPDSLKGLFLSLTNGEYFNMEREKKVILDDVSFSIGRGEIVGIMGRNGTGKSTLLRILCGIYQADEGTVVVKERIAAMVALGAGFHPELSGYENIFLNGAIMGIPRDELKRIAPQILEFSELGDQIHHAVKTYSSGMVVRLGFSVASHVDAPILVLDEVFGVGDEGFQRKCFARLDELFKSGRTMILVTHDPSQIKRFCKRCLVLENGKIVFDGSAEGGSKRYSELFGSS